MTQGSATARVASIAALTVGQKILMRSDQKDYVADNFESQTYGQV